MPRPPAIFVTSRLTARTPRSDDGPAVFAAYANDPEVTKYLSWRAYDRVEPLNAFLRECAAHWEKGDGHLAWLLCLKGTDTPIGSIGIDLEGGGKAMFGYVLAYLVLGETLTGTQLAGGLLIIFGVLSVSIAGRKSREKVRWQLAGLMLTCGFIMSLSTLIFKAFAVKDEFWATTFWMFAGEALFGVVFLSVAGYRSQFLYLVRTNGRALLAINASNELINLGGGLANRYALIFAPLSIVQAVGSTTTLFVFGIGVILTLFFPKYSQENLSKRELVSKGIAAVLVCIGITMVSR